MYRETWIHVVIPAYNVAGHIGDVLKGLPAFVDAVTVVDDGSTDDTLAAIRATVDDRVTVITNGRNLGVGGAMVVGFERAVHDGDGIVVKMDGDGQMDPAYLPRLLDPIIDGRCDYTKGNRFLFDRELDAMPRPRLAGNFILTFLTKLASGYWNVFDPQNGYVAVHSSALRLLDLERLSKRYFFENDMLINLNVFDLRVKDVAIPACYGNERSSMNLGQVLCSFPFLLFCGYWRRFYRKHVLRDFSAVALFMLTGVPLLTFGVCFGAYTWLQSFLQNQFASTGTVMLSVLPFLVGFELVLQALVLEIKDTPK
jgi:glycosyltransferase involved in cell wall biosynthesis